MTLQAELQRRGITEVLHFTTNRGIVGTLAREALLSRYRLPDEAYLKNILRVNAATRPEASDYFDKSNNWLDYVNLSISEINRRYFNVSQGWHPDADIWWGILAFDAEVILDEGVWFATTNNSYDRCVREQGEQGFNSLFVATVPRKRNDWFAYRHQRSPELPTCEQAEVLYPGELSTEHLRRIYVIDESCQDTVRGWLREFRLAGVDVVISPEKFLGKPN